MFPHVAEVLDLADDPIVREIYLPWAARCAKTTTSLSLLMFWTVNYPRPSLFASSTEDKVDDDIESKLYPMLEACAATKWQLLPKHQRNKRFIRLRRCRIRKAYAGSPSTLAGFPACYIVNSEASKWVGKKSEGDPIKLSKSRARNYPFESKAIYESTPSKRGVCKISKLINSAGVDRRFRHVPCPHCNRYQILFFFPVEGRLGGVKWPRDKAGNYDPVEAAENAYYECEHCGKHIENHHRPGMIRAGVWLSEGLSIDKSGEIVGKARYPGSTKVALCGPRGGLSALYSLAIGGWGTLVSEWLACGSDSEARQEFWNQTLAEEYSETNPPPKPHELIERLVDPGQTSKIVPAWGKFLTVGIDAQANLERFPWWISAWGDGGSGAEIDHGETIGWDNVVAQVIKSIYPHADGGRPLPVHWGLMDSGDEAEECYALCRGIRNILPAKGASKSFPLEYRVSDLKPEERRNKNAVGDVRIVLINTHFTQRWAQNLILGEDTSYKLSADSALDAGMLDQLLNEHRVPGKDKEGRPTWKWERITRSLPNDFRDAWRMSKVAAWMVTQNGALWNKLPPRPKPGQDPPATAQGQEKSFVRQPAGVKAGGSFIRK